MSIGDDLGRLARRDVAVFAVGTVAAVAAIGTFVLSRTDVGLSRHDAALAVVIASLPVALVCIAWWGAGPATLLRSRLMVLVPAFLVVGPAVGGLLVLGATVTGACFVAAATIVVGLCFGVLLARATR